MPTVLLLDVSLSMSRNVLGSDANEECKRRNLAIQGINILLDQITASNKLEFISLVVYSSLWEQVVPFTRDTETIRTALTKIEEYDKSNILGALGGLNSFVLEEWGAVTPCQIILVTDGNTGIGKTSLEYGLQELGKVEQTKLDDQAFSLLKSTDFPLPFRFNGKLHIICISSPQDPNIQNVLPLYQRLIDINDNGGKLFSTDGPLTYKNVEAVFQKLGEQFYHPFIGSLKCGHLHSRVQLCPPPEPHTKTGLHGNPETVILDRLDILGFISIADVSSPPIVSRHLVLPLSVVGNTEKLETSTDNDTKEDDEKEDGKSACFTVLLHGSLKVEGMVAITQIGEDWYGMLYSWADSKKKANLLLSPFEPGLDSIPWLGSFSNLSPLQDFSESPFGSDDDKTPFPVKQHRRSYAQNSTVWIKTPGLQADVQKILRHCRKLPEKQQHFYKELNRLRRMALSLGFTELLDAMSQMLERECTLLPGNAHPDAALQLSHASTLLKSASAREYGSNITPLRTNFSSDD